MGCTPSAQSCTQECHALVKGVFARDASRRLIVGVFAAASYLKRAVRVTLTLGMVNV